MEENTKLPKEAELITEDRLKELGFEFVDYGDNPPYETYRKDGIEVSEYNGECWLIEMLDQNNIERPIKYLSELETFFNGCGQSIYGATAYATKLHQANEVIKVLTYDNNKLNGQVEGLTNAVEELKGQPGARWVKADTKPEHNVGVLVFIPGEDNHITSGMWDISNEWVLLDEYRTPEEEVTHWMLLPAFPEGYPINELPDEAGAIIKEIAKEELGLFKAIQDAEQSKEEDLKAVKEVIADESAAGREDGAEAFAKFLDEQRSSVTAKMWNEKAVWNKPEAFQEWLQYFKQQKEK